MHESDASQHQTGLVEERLKLENRLRDGASWFFWIAGLSVINSIVLLVGGGWNFLIGLGITSLIADIASGIATQVGSNVGTIVKIIAFVIDVGVAGVFVVFGVLARKRYKWSFIIGMVLYALDGLIFLLVSDFLSIGFHLVALFGLNGGLRAHRKLSEMERARH